LRTVTYIFDPFISVLRYFSNVLGWEYFSAVISKFSYRVLGYNPTSISLLLFTFQYISVTVSLAFVQLKTRAVHYNSLGNNSTTFIPAENQKQRL
jgi:hypothetical protein